MKSVSTALIFLLLSLSTFAQYAKFATSGVIEFEKKINMYALIKRNITKDNEAFLNPVFEQFKKTKPQFKTLKSTLTFSKDKSLFSPIEDADAAAHLFSNHPAAMQINTVFNDFTAKSSIVQKKVFEQTFLVKDTTRNITWKITDETREIAGYTCRRANAIVMDSVYVVAFYSDEIPVSGGPEIFSGLPGMILGVALPHENITWFATAVKDNSVGELKPPAKGKATDNSGLRKTLAAATKQWGEYAQKYLKIFLL